MIGPLLGFLSLASPRERQGQVQLPGSPICLGEVAHVSDGMIGAELGILELERFLVERRARSSFPASRYALARLPMLTSVSGWSGPSFALSA